MPWSSTSLPGELNVKVAASIFDPSRGDEVLETHVSTVAFEGDLAHKRKKAVHFPFIDLSTVERREEVCHREVELNRRFSPDVYLGVEDVVDDEGRIIDHAVRMQRMPAERRLSTLVRAGADVTECLRSVARQVAIVHADGVTSDAITAVATPDALAALWDENLTELATFTPKPLAAGALADVATLAHRYLEGRASLLHDRIARGRVLDGHGDLLADDIYCLDDGPRILDCLEFDDLLRWGDVLYDVGFLAMDLERLGRPDLAADFLATYRALSAESHPPSLEHHYIAYRALVRAKISCLRGSPADDDEARTYLAQCLHHLAVADVRLVVVGGLPGTGKSTVAIGLGDRLGWPVLRSDELRKSRAGILPTESAAAGYQKGLYTPDQTEATYAELLDEATLMLREGTSVIVDASFARERWRETAREAAAASHARLVEVQCVLSPEVVRARLASRAVRGDVSDADASTSEAMRHDFEDWPTAIELDTEASLDLVLAQVCAAVAPERG